METKVVLLGTGTPNADPDRSGPAVAVIVGERSYLVDFGPGVVRRAAQGYKMGIEALRADRLTTGFLTHLHSDHSAGYVDLILTPWVLDRRVPLKVFGPTGTEKMTGHILNAYEVDIQERVEGLEPGYKEGVRVEVTEITGSANPIYQDDCVSVSALRVPHGGLESYAYRFTTVDGKIIVISGDTAPNPALIPFAKNCDLLVHEVYSATSFRQRTPEWQKYHSTVHTSTLELGQLCKEITPKCLVLYHQLFMIDVNGNDPLIPIKVAEKDAEMLAEIAGIYHGEVISGKDLQVFCI